MVVVLNGFFSSAQLSSAQLLLPVRATCFLMLGNCSDSMEVASAGLDASAGPSAFFLAAFFFLVPFFEFSNPSDG